jgi:hypothetical protein
LCALLVTDLPIASGTRELPRALSGPVAKLALT